VIMLFWRGRKGISLRAKADLNVRRVEHVWMRRYCEPEFAPPAGKGRSQSRFDLKQQTKFFPVTRNLGRMRFQ
jgi:hypothetical protein